MAETYNDLFFGYAAIFVIISFFVFRVVRDQIRMSRELEQIKKDRAIG